MAGLVEKVSNAPKFRKPGRLPAMGTVEAELMKALRRSVEVDPFQFMDNFGYKDKPSHVTFTHMQRMAEQNSVVAAVLQTRIAQAASFAQTQKDQYHIGFQIKRRDKQNKKSMTKAELKETSDICRFLLNTGREEDMKKDDFEAFIKKVVRDSLTYDQMTFEVTHRRNGKPDNFYAVDAATIRRGREKAGSAKPMVDYVQIMENKVVRTFSAEEMAFCIRNPRTNVFANGYGFSELETLVTTVTSHLWAEEYNRRYFSQGTVPKGMINLKSAGGSIHTEHLDSFRRQWLAQAAGVNGSFKTPIMAFDGDLQWIPLSQTNRDMEYQLWLEYLIKVVCSIYLIDPAEVNFDLRGGVTNQAPMFETSNESKQKLSRDRGLAPLLRFLSAKINKYIVHPLNEDMELEFVGLDARTPQEALDMRVREVGSYETLNKVRKDADPNAEDIEHGDIPLNPVYIQLLQMKQMEKQMAQGMGEGGEEGEMEEGGSPEDEMTALAGEIGGDMGKALADLRKGLSEVRESYEELEVEL